VPLFDLIADLPLTVESHALDNMEREVSSGFLRRTTIVRLRGQGAEGVGEDVVYTAELHPPFQAMSDGMELEGTWTVASFSRHAAGLDLFDADLDHGVYRNYRQWAFDSAALDLALRQAGLSLPKALGRAAGPVNFVVSLRLGEPPSLDPIRERLAIAPALRFKLDATSSWDERLIAELHATGAVASIDFKGAYHGTVVDQPPDPVLYRRVAEGLPDVWLEDPALTPEIDKLFEPYRERITWDAVITSVADIEALPFPPRTVNVKPSRFGTLEALFAAYDYLDEHGIGGYGGGQFELGPGRGQIQALASVFHPDGANDIAPGGYNDPHPKPGLPSSPLPGGVVDPGFGWAS
jgi:hypothetical protein